jgi:hypothetical protein
MATTLDNTLSGELSNSYCDVPYFDDYFSGHYDASRTAAAQALSDTQKQQILVSACFDIEQLRFVLPTDFNNRPWFYDPTSGRYLQTSPTVQESFRYNYWQQLQFPRTNDIYSSGVAYIPDPVFMAQCEQAVFKISADRTTLTNSVQGVRSDSVNVNGIQLSQRIDPGGILISPDAVGLLRKYMLKRNVKLTRGG